MSSEEKPYRVSRGGRVKGKVPTLPRPERRAKPDGSGPDKPGRTRPKRRRNYRRWFAIALGLFLAWATAWTLAGYFTFRDGVKAANARLPEHVRSQLKEQGGLLLTHSTTVLLLGTDTGPGRKGIRHSDSVMLVRTDPDHHRISYLSIPRDLRVEIPGHGAEKINTAYQIGGAPLAVATVRNLTGIDVNHVAIVNFARFEKLIDAVGGIDVNVPAPIHSDRFDCPYTPAACGGVRAGEAVRVDRRRHVDVDSADRVDQLLEAREVDDGHVVDVDPGQVPHRRHRERRPPDLVRGVDLVRSVAGNLDAEVSRDGEVGDAVMVRVGANEHDGVGVPDPLSPRARVRAEQEDRRRVRQQQAALLLQLRAHVVRQPRVRGLDAVPEGEVAGERPGRRPGQEEPERDREPAPVVPPPLRPGPARLVGSAPVGLRPTLGSRQRRDLALDASAAVDAVGLLLRRHPTAYASRRA